MKHGHKMKAEQVARRMASRRKKDIEMKHRIKEFCVKYGPQLIEEYEENGIMIKRYEAR